MRLSRYRDARQTLSTLGATTAEQRLDLARCDWGSGDYARALESFRELYTGTPSDAPVALAYVQALISLGHTAEAVELLAELGQGSINLPGIALLESCRLACTGDYAAAVSCLGKCLELYPENTGLGSCLRLVKALQDGADRELSLPANDARAAAQADSQNWLNRELPDKSYYWSEPELLRQCIKDSPATGLILECGVFHGRSLDIIAAEVEQDVFGFDSFEGLPEDWTANEPKGSYSTGGRLPAVAANVKLVKGWFEDTLPEFLARHGGPVRLAHIDCDLYSSTRTVLAALTGRLQPGAIVVFDDFLGFPGFRQHEFRAFHEWVAQHGIETQISGAVFFGRVVAFRIISNPAFSARQAARQSRR